MTIISSQSSTLTLMDMANMNDEDWLFVEIAALGFKQHDVIEADYAKILLDLGLLQISPIRIFKFGVVIIERCCVRFTTAGRKATRKFQSSQRLTAEELKNKPDFLELDIRNNDFTSKFLMHDRRLAKELAAKPDRAGAVLGRYARHFEKS